MLPPYGGEPTFAGTSESRRTPKDFHIQYTAEFANLVELAGREIQICSVTRKIYSFYG